MKKYPLHSPSYFVPTGKNPETLFKWRRFHCEIKNRRGEIFFEMRGVEAPEGWSQLAVEIAASKYLRKSGIPKVKTEKSVRQLM
ncbi:MAG: Vitamin B12-dependent ribonucleotide reductase, partial [Bacillota bacterium]